jgi:hypothetical protein
MPAPSSPQFCCVSGPGKSPRLIAIGVVQETAPGSSRQHPAAVDAAAAAAEAKMNSRRQVLRHQYLPSDRHSPYSGMPTIARWSILINSKSAGSWRSDHLYGSAPARLGKRDKEFQFRLPPARSHSFTRSDLLRLGHAPRHNMRDDAVTRPREHLHRPARVRVWRRSYALPKGQLARRGSCNVAAHPERLWPVRRITRRRWRRIGGRRGITRPRWWPVSRDWRVGVISRLQLGKLCLVKLIGAIVSRRISAAEAGIPSFRDKRALDADWGNSAALPRDSQ